jgi:hypothetical protein
MSTRPTLTSCVLLLVGFISLLVALPATAQVIYTGDTTGSPTFHRPLPGFPPADLSAGGTEVRYHRYDFTPPETGLYEFFCQAESGQDPFLALYAGAFDALASLTNCVGANDDLTLANFQQSGLRMVLTAGTPYVIVTTGFANHDFGAFTNTITPLAALRASYDGTTQNGSLWNRPEVGSPPATLSSQGTAVPHEVLKVEVAVSGRYFFRSRALTSEYDIFVVLYENHFDSASPLTHALLARDDEEDIFHTALEVDLQAGTPYLFVTTGHANTHVGDYHLDVCGPGAVALTLSRKIAGTLLREDGIGVPFDATCTLHPLDGSEDRTMSIRVDAAGNFLLHDIPAKNYQIKVKTANTLSRVMAADATLGDVADLAFPALKGGDACEDNSVDILDLDCLIQAFDSDPNQPHWNPNADFDGNASVDVLDLDILIRNFDQMGEDFS